jgi:ribosomal protein S18 acetylase RimI-like enzyme
MCSYDSDVLFATATLARRVEAAERSLITDFARPVQARLGEDGVFIGHVSGGTAVAAGPTAPFSKVAGLGFEGLDEAALLDVEREFATRNTPVRVELSILADPQIAARLTARGYRLIGFENVLGRSLAGYRADPSEVTVSSMPADRALEWIRIITTAFATPDVFDAPPSQDVIDRESLEATFAEIADIGGVQLYVACLGEDTAGGASMRISDGIAQMCGAGTLPEHRRRGVQTALLQHRLAHAAARGCDLAIVTAQPGSVSQRNVQRQGFELLYTRAILVLEKC